MTDPNLKAAAVDAAQAHVEDTQAACSDQPVDLRQRIVLEVLVADGVKGILLEHGRQIALLQDPDAVGCKYRSDVGDERPRILQVVEHGNRGDGASTRAAAFRFGSVTTRRRTRPTTSASGRSPSANAAFSLMSEQPYADFRARVSSIRDRLRALIETEVSRGKRIYVYGASTKGNVLFQHFGLDASLIRACADKNPIKWGRRTPATNIPIIAEDAARADADYFLVLPWSFKDEFLARETEYRAKGGKFIFPLPEIEVC